MAGDTSRESGRKGGRPRGSVTRPQISDLVTDYEAKAIVDRIKERALVDDGMSRFVQPPAGGREDVGVAETRRRLTENQSR